MDGFEKNNLPIILLCITLAIAGVVGVAMIGFINESYSNKQQRRERRLERSSDPLLKEQRRERRTYNNKGNAYEL